MSGLNDDKEFATKVGRWQEMWVPTQPEVGLRKHLPHPLPAGRGIESKLQKSQRETKTLPEY